MNRSIIHAGVGLFLILGFLALLFLALRVSDFQSFYSRQSYTITANFDNIGGLKIRAPVSISGVTIGSVTQIQLNPVTYRAVVTMTIDDHYRNIPIDSTAEILTQGILGSNYIGLIPGLDQNNLKSGEAIKTTHSALILEDLIGKWLFKNQTPQGEHS